MNSAVEWPVTNLPLLRKYPRAIQSCGGEGTDTGNLGSRDGSIPDLKGDEACGELPLLTID
jgi:hypothetical protein